MVTMVSLPIKKKGVMSVNITPSFSLKAALAGFQTSGITVNAGFT